MTHHHRRQQPGPDEPAQAAPANSSGEPDNISIEAQAGQPPPPEAAGTPEVEALKAEREDLLDKLARLSAEFVNYQKRVAREQAELAEYANANLMRELLPVLDDLERALEAGRAGHAHEDGLLKGVAMVCDKLLELLRRAGVREIEAQDEPFDPTRHQALMQQPSPKHEAPTVLRVLQKGYEMKGRVLRPAQVAVSYYKPDAPNGEEK